MPFLNFGYRSSYTALYIMFFKFLLKLALELQSHMFYTVNHILKMFCHVGMYLTEDNVFHKVLVNLQHQLHVVHSTSKVGVWRLVQRV